MLCMKLKTVLRRNEKMTVNVSTKPREKCAACTFTPKPIELLKRISEINIFNNNMNSCCHLLLMRLASLESELSRAELSTAQQSSAQHSTAAAKPILEIPKELRALASMRFRCGAIEKKKKKKKKTILSQQSSKCQPQL